MSDTNVTADIATLEAQRAELKARAKQRIAEIDKEAMARQTERAALVVFLDAPEPPKPRKRRRDAGVKRVSHFVEAVPE